MECYCYILECADGTLYTGWTTDPERRVNQHNKGTGARYTKTRRPVKLVYLEPQADKISALKRKSHQGSHKKTKNEIIYVGTRRRRVPTIINR